MRSILTIIILAALSLADEPAPACDGVPPPPPLTDIVFDPLAAKYAGPLCMEGETCEPVIEEHPGVRVTEEGTEYTFTYVGEIRAVERDGKWESEELVMLPAPPPACWAWQWREWQP